jgi:ABC-type branched-subunit amino acid transport system ATPase component
MVKQEQILSIRGIEKSFGGLKALNKTTLGVEKGKIIAIIGPNGSGKTTLFNAIGKLMPYEAGRIKLGKEDLKLEKDYGVARLGISRTFQQVRLFKNLSIRDHLMIALSCDDESILKSLRHGDEDHSSRIKEILGLVGLDKDIRTLAENLSYGQRKLLDLAVAIAKPHTLLMLDEPVAGVNPKLREEIKKILKKLNKSGESILVIEHDMNFVMDLADWIYVMDSGKVIAEGKPKTIQKNKRVLEAYLGE